jgi:hypothetical protein
MKKPVPRARPTPPSIIICELQFIISMDNIHKGIGHQTHFPLLLSGLSEDLGPMGSFSLCLNRAVVRKPRWTAGMAEGLNAKEDRTMRADMMIMMKLYCWR